MRVSTKGRYALRMMIEFGLNPDQCTKISQVAARQGISDKYLEQIVSLLHKAGYVRSIRGAQGGYMLTRKPEEYTVGMILRAAEGSLAPVSCLDEDINHCEHAGRCTTPYCLGAAEGSHRQRSRQHYPGRSDRGAEKHAGRKPHVGFMFMHNYA